VTEEWLDARTATRFLGIQARTLYAYVSRGLVRSVPGARGRPRLYSRPDLERLRVRRDARRGHGAVAAGALRWGEPVLDSSLTAITSRGPAYRGHLAVELATDGYHFEQVAELLWSGTLPERAPRWPRPALAIGALARLVPANARPLDAMALVVPLAALGVPARKGADDSGGLARGRQLVALLAAVLAEELHPATVTRALGAPTIAAIVARALRIDDALAPLIDRALILLADHELNASSFAARVAASTEAEPYACVTAALATASGPRHGAASEHVAAFADEVGAPERARAAVRALRKRQQLPPGFGHPLYPQGDPRAAPLLAAAAGSTNHRARTLLAIVEATEAPPSVDVGLATLVASLGAPAAAASGLFAVARSAGWLAHALEQRAAGFLLRPRARYVGVPVDP
jgi:citrate synthase